MNYKSIAMQYLRDYNVIKAGVKNLEDEINTLRTDLSDIKATDYSALRVMSMSGNPAEDKRIDTICAIIELEKNYAFKKNDLDRIERALFSLTEQQRQILDRFHINRPAQKSHVEVLAAELGYQKTRIYELYNYAIRDFTVAMYGIVDS